MLRSRFLLALAGLAGGSAFGADVAIVQNFPSSEITTLQGWLTQLGHTSTVYSQAAYTSANLTASDLVIWDDLSFQSGGLNDTDVNLFNTAFDANVPFYFIGDDLSFSNNNLALSVRPIWQAMTHLNIGSNGSVGGTLSITAPTHPVIAGPHGTVNTGFSLGNDPDAATRTNTGEVLLGQRGANDVLLAWQGLANRTVTQNFMPTNSNLTESEKLFKNAVTWLLSPFPLAGDANQNGVIDRDDFSLIDRGFAMQLTGFSNGDFNGDGVVNDTDYAILHNSLATQGGFSPGGAGLGVVAAVPEPGLVGLLVAPMVMGLTRRRRD